MNFGFDISQTGAEKAGCAYYTHAMIKAMLAIAPQHRYALYPSFGDFYFDAKMPTSNPYRSEQVSYGPRHLTRQTARAFWSQAQLDTALGHPDIVPANNFWAPAQLTSSRLIYTLYDMEFMVNPAWTTESNRVGCFDGVFRATTSMPEVAGDAAMLLSPHDQQAWTQAMLDLASDEGKRHRLGLAARARAKHFDWERSAASMLAIYEEATRSPKRASMNQTTSHKGDPLVESVG